MNWGLILATTQTILSLGAAIGYIVQRDWKHGVYWLCAAGITAIVTWGFK
jgi:hypothetical protein